jgi:hypothetical protein
LQCSSRPLTGQGDRLIERAIPGHDATPRQNRGFKSGRSDSFRTACILATCQRSGLGFRGGPGFGPASRHQTASAALPESP